MESYVFDLRGERRRTLRGKEPAENAAVGRPGPRERIWYIAVASISISSLPSTLTGAGQPARASCRSKPDHGDRGPALSGSAFKTGSDELSEEAKTTLAKAAEIL